MADAEKAALKSGSGAPPESPTTARPLDFDDELQEGSGSATAGDLPTASTPLKEDAPPAKPPRPLSPREQAEVTLKEAFPSIDTTVIKAVLSASGGQVEPAFNALLGMSDPDSQKEPEPPAKPPRPTGPTSTGLSQLEADELYARQLAEHYSGAGRRGPGQPQRMQQAQRPPYGDDEREHSFFDDDLPVIRENLRKGFLDTQQTVNKWVQNFKKRLDGEDLDDIDQEQGHPTQGYPGRSGSPMYGRRSGETTRRSADRDRYDADPQVLPDDFSTLELRDAEAPPPRPPRPLANPDLFKPTPTPPSGRQVSFHDGPPDDLQSDPYSTNPPRRATSTGKSSKWQPLSSVDPSPVADNDPFSLGDSDDDKDTKKARSSDEAERLQKATAEAMSDDISGKDEPGKPEKS